MPYRFAPIGGNTPFNDALPAINANFAQLDQEAVTKTFKNGAGNTGLVIGRLPNDQGTGILLNDTDGNAAIKMAVGSDDTPLIETLDTSGNVLRKTVEGTDYYYDASGVNYMQIGLLTNGSYGVKIAQSGVDVGSATNSQLVFNSAQDVFKIADKIQTSIPSFTASASSIATTSVTIAHGQSVEPIVDCYVKGQYFSSAMGSLLSTNYIRLPLNQPSGSYIISSYFFPDTGSGSWLVNIGYGVDSTNVYVQASFENTNGTSTTLNAIPLTIFVLQETAS